MILRPGIGFFAAPAASGLIELVVSGTVYDYNVFAKAALVGDPSANVVDGLVRLLYQPGAVIGSTSTSTPACFSGSGWGTGWSIDHVVSSGGARIQGRGGNGGNGSFRGVLTGPPGEQTCESNGSRSGGGGGGAGSNPGAGGSPNGGSATATAGGAAGFNVGSGNCQVIASTAGGAGGPALRADTGGPNHFLRPAAGATLEVWGGGGGGNSNVAGGGPGLASSGAAGAAYQTPGAATITESGPGVIDKRGA
jgi:hypothetical protein